jgi:hypothetical protein
MTPVVLVCQFGLLAFHQVTTLVNLSPFNGARHYSRGEKVAEAGVNGVLMSLPPIGTLFDIHGLILFGVIYYFVLFGIEIWIWWIPYFTVPAGRWRAIYNRVLALATSNFEPGDTLDHWRNVYDRIHRGTVTILPDRPSRIVPNLEHTLLHALTLITAVVTAVRYFDRN